MLSSAHPDLPYNPVSSSLATAAWGTSVAAEASANTYGAWVQVHAGFAHAVSLLVVNLNNNYSSATTRNAYVDLGVGPSAANVSPVAEKLLGSHAGGFASGNMPRTFLLPITIPASTPVWARHQNTVASATISVHLTGSGGASGMPGVSRAVPLGTLGTGTTTGIAISPGVSGAEGAWTEAIASTASSYCGFLVAGMSQVDTTLTAIGYTLDIGVGGAGTEVSIGENACWTVHFTTEAAGAVSVPVWAGIPAGQRMVVRASCSGAIDTSPSFILYGMLP